MNAIRILTEEPGAIIPHAGICAGGTQETEPPTAIKISNRRFFDRRTGGEDRRNRKGFKVKQFKRVLSGSIEGCYFLKKNLKKFLFLLPPASCSPVCAKQKLGVSCWVKVPVV